MANEFGFSLVPIYITKTAASAGTALYSVTRLVHSFIVQKSTAATTVTVGTSSGGVKLAARESVSFLPHPNKQGPIQYDLSQFKVVAAAASSVTVTVIAIVNKAQANNPPS